MNIKNGMGQVIDFSYNYISDYETYNSSEATAKIRPLRSPLLLVNSIRQPDGSITTYDFKKPKYHTEGKGFLGFTTVTTTNPQRPAYGRCGFVVDIYKCGISDRRMSQHASAAHTYQGYFFVRVAFTN